MASRSRTASTTCCPACVRRSLIKIFGDDLDTLRGQADALRGRLAGIPGIADLEIEKQVLAPQIKVRVDYATAAQYGVPTPQILATLQSLVEGEKVTQVVEGSRRFALVVRLPESAARCKGLGQILLETPGGPIPLSKIATIEDGDGPNQVSRDDGKRRIVISANAQGRATVRDCRGHPQGRRRQQTA